MAVYPERVWSRCIATRLDKHSHTSANGKAVSFSCGCFTAVSLGIDAKMVLSASFESNGCGYMVAASQVLTASVDNKPLSELNSLPADAVISGIEDAIGPVHADRRPCIQCPVEALRRAFYNYRSHQIEEFRGEKPLICTCFGITEETVERYIETAKPTTTGEVTRAFRAGSGCGSCLMMIQEIIDGRR